MLIITVKNLQKLFPINPTSERLKSLCFQKPSATMNLCNPREAADAAELNRKFTASGDTKQFLHRNRIFATLNFFCVQDGKETCSGKQRSNQLKCSRLFLLAHGKFVKRLSELVNIGTQVLLGTRVRLIERTWPGCCGNETSLKGVLAQVR